MRKHPAIRGFHRKPRLGWVLASNPNAHEEDAADQRVANAYEEVVHSGYETDNLIDPDTLPGLIGFYNEDGSIESFASAAKYTRNTEPEDSSEEDEGEEEEKQGEAKVEKADSEIVGAPYRHYDDYSEEYGSHGKCHRKHKKKHCKKHKHKCHHHHPGYHHGYGGYEDHNDYGGYDKYRKRREVFEPTGPLIDSSQVSAAQRYIMNLTIFLFINRGQFSGTGR